MKGALPRRSLKKIDHDHVCITDRCDGDHVDIFDSSAISCLNYCAVEIDRSSRWHQVDKSRFAKKWALELEELHARHGINATAEFRDAIGIGRKRAIQVLEFFDRVGYTRRICQGRIVRADSGWRESAWVTDRKACASGGAAGLQTRWETSSVSR
jgi:hypothetical protein